MSTILNTNGDGLEIPAVHSPRDSFAIIQAEWNEQITDALAAGARDVLLQAGVKPSNIHLIKVPGTVEVVAGAHAAIQHLKPSAVITIGCVIRGDTPHFDYVCQSATQGVTWLNATGNVPVIFSVLTVENLQQALDRAGGCLGNKGAEGAVAALKMAALFSND